MGVNYRILLVEDDESVALSLLDGLEKEGFETTWTPNGSQGIETLASGQIHLVLLDIRLPDISGFDVCREIRRKGLHQPKRSMQIFRM
jgi:DNA-binding response OmpR family regulator